MCEECLAQVSRGAHPEIACNVCGEAIEPDSDEAFSVRHSSVAAAVLCPECLVRPRAFSLAVAHGDYTGKLRELIHLLKFHAVRSTAGTLGRLAAQAAVARFGAGHDVVLCAVPLHRSRRRQRGFNQAELLARATAKHLRRAGWKVQEEHRALRRQRSTDSQYTLNALQRRANLRGAFVSGPGIDRVRGREVLLLDDIMTTGTTANLCAAALHAGGATRVLVVTVARSQPAPAARWIPEGPAQADKWIGPAQANPPQTRQGPSRLPEQALLAPSARHSLSPAGGLL